MPKGTSKGYSSFRYIQPKKAVGLDGTEQSVELNQMIKESISSQMKAHGLQMGEGKDADLVVAYLVIMQDNFKTSNINQYYGYQDYTEIVELAHEKGMKDSFPEYVQKGALVIDLIDAETYQLVYRDFAVRGIQGDLSQDARREKIDKAVSEILQKFFK